MHKKTKLELSNLVELETLINFAAYNSSLEDLHGMSRLRTLGIKIAGGKSLETLFASIGELRHLENLDILYFTSSYEDERMKEEDGTVLDFINLKKLKLAIFGSLSGELHFPLRLTILNLYKCSLEEDPMPILEKLLHLKEVSFEYKSFSGKKMVCSAGGFPQLEKLFLSELEEWEKWIVEEGSMNLLHTLVIVYCEKLKEYPDGLIFITSLKHLEVVSKEENWNERFSEGGKYYYKVQHIPYVLKE